jgi:hypothetical protein
MKHMLSVGNIRKNKLAAAVAHCLVSGIVQVDHTLADSSAVLRRGNGSRQTVLTECGASYAHKQERAKYL